MSVAVDLSFEELNAPIFVIPERARTQRPLATVTQLHRPSTQSAAAPLRLTRRGVVVLGGLVALLAAALIGLAWASAPSLASNGSNAALVPANVSVQQGD